MKVWLIQSVLSPYRVKLFQNIAETPGVQFKLILLSSKFKTRPQWKRNLSNLPFSVDVPFGLSYQTGPEHQYCINPFLIFKLLWSRPDVVICGGYSFATLLVWLTSWVTRIRYVIWTEATRHTDGGIAGFRLSLRRLMVRRARAIVDAGTLARKYVRYLDPSISTERLFRAFNCVDNNHFGSNEPKDSSFFSQKGLPAKNLLFVGALNDRKGVPQLLQVYSRLVEEIDPPPGLILIGEGELRAEIERLKAQHGLANLRLEGWVENRETARYYAQSDAFVLLSKTDHNPLVLFEALAAGLPIICSNGACNAVDFIKEGWNGYIVDPKNTSEILNRTTEVLSWDLDRRQACRSYSREVVAKANYRDAAAAFFEACVRASAKWSSLPIGHATTKTVSNRAPQTEDR